MAAGAETTHNLTADAGTSTKAIEAVGGQVVFYSAVTSKKPATRATAFRSGLTTADATANLDAAGYVGANNLAVDNSAHVALSCRFSVASQSAAVFLAFYDANDNLIGISRDYSFVGDATFKDGSAGKFFASLELVDVAAATQVYPVLRSAPASGNVDIYIEAL